MYDGWGRKFAYAMWTPMASERGFLGYRAGSNCGAITVTDAGASNRTQKGVYVLLSFGPDGHGGYLKGGTRMNAGTTNPDQQVNCHCDASAANATYAATYVQKGVTADPAAPTAGFDDILRFKERWQMMNATDRHQMTGGSLCTLGFRIDGNAGDLLGYGFSYGGYNTDEQLLDINGDTQDDLFVSAAGTGKVYTFFGKDGLWDSPYLVSSLNGNNGFFVKNDLLSGGGYYISNADVDGDGNQDLIASHYGGWAAHTWVIFGQQASWITQYDAYVGGGSPNMDGTTGAVILHTGAETYGAPGTGIGKFNNDAYDDILITPGCTTLDTVVLGGPRPWIAARDTNSMPHGTQKIRFDHSLGYNCYGGVTATDINGDGYTEIFRGYYNDLYVIRGGSGPEVGGNWIGPYDWETINDPGQPTATVIETPGGGYPYWVASGIAAGDLNGDGTSDIIASNWDSIRSYIFFGDAGFFGTSWPDGWDPTVTFTGSNGFLISGITSPYNAGIADVNGDGRKDLISFLRFASATNYTVIRFGTASHNPTYDWNIVGNGTDGVIMHDAPSNNINDRQWAFGDVNGDDIDDIVLADYRYSGSLTDAGIVYVIFGRTSGWPATLNLLAVNAFDGTNGTIIRGLASGDMLGYTLALADLTGDDIKEIVMCAPYADHNGANSGSCYVLYGHSGTWQASIDLSSL
jgi:hypothetical protein